jgi:hypothetical protein
MGRLIRITRQARIIVKNLVVGLGISPCYDIANKTQERFRSTRTLHVRVEIHIPPTDLISLTNQEHFATLVRLEGELPEGKVLEHPSLVMLEQK